MEAIMSSVLGVNKRIMTVHRTSSIMAAIGEECDLALLHGASHVVVVKVDWQPTIEYDTVSYLAPLNNAQGAQ